MASTISYQRLLSAAKRSQARSPYMFSCVVRNVHAHCSIPMRFASQAATSAAAQDSFELVSAKAASAAQVSSLSIPTTADLMAGRPSLEEEFPELAAEWHPTMNGSLTARDVNIFSRQVVWWKCNKDPQHVWAEPVRGRLGRTWRNKLLKQLELKRLDGGQEKGGERTFPGHYIRENAVYDTASLPAPLAELVTDIIKGDKHACYTRGWGITVLPEEGAPATGLGPIAQHWETDPLAYGVAWMELRNFRQDRSPTPYERCRSKGWSTELLRQIYKPQPCPCCSAKRSVFSYKFSLEAARPDLAKAMHPVLNGTLKPKDVAQWSSIDVWWQCPKSPDHVWRGPIYELARRGRRAVTATGEESTPPPAAIPDVEDHVHVDGIPCAYCQRRYPDRLNNVAKHADQLLYRYNRVRNGRPPQFASCSDSSLPRYWWDVKPAAGASILLPSPFAQELEVQQLWESLSGVISRSTPEELQQAICSEIEWLSDGGIGPLVLPVVKHEVPTELTALTDFSMKHLLACLPSLPYYSPIATETSGSDLFLQRDMSGSMHQVGDRIRITLRSLVKLLCALRDWELVMMRDPGKKTTDRAIANATARFNRLYQSMLEAAPGLVPSKQGVETFRNFRRVSAQNARKKRDMLESKA